MRVSFFCKIFIYLLGSFNKMKLKGCLLYVMINGIYFVLY